ncbi:MAG: hypothetical protein ACC645_24675, partial [Pirellulales bacterium]
FLLLDGATPALAQGAGVLQIEDFSGIIELGFLTDLQDRTRSSSSGSEFDRVELSQILNFNTSGSIYHPRFLTFNAGLQLEMIEGMAGQSNDRILVGGDWRFNFLENHPNSLSTYGRVLDSEVQRPFSETYQITDELYGVTFFQKWGWIPFEISYQHLARSGGVGDQLDDSADKMIFDGRYQIGERSDGRLGYDLAYEEILGQDIRRQNLVATNLSYLGDGDDKRLRTDFRFDEQRNGQNLSIITGRTDFDWEHSDNLRTRYVFNSRWSDSVAQTSTNLSPNFFLTHQLYDSLRSNLEIFGQFEDASFRTRNEFGGRVDVNYLKQLGDWGRLNINVSPQASMIYNRLEEDAATIFDERHVMVGLQSTILRQQDIVESSIVVTDENGSIVYDEGPLGDYVVNQVSGGFETELVRTPISNIADGQLVLVDYEYELPGDGDTLLTGVAVYTSLAFLDHWSVFGRYDNINYHVLSGSQDALRFNDYNRYVAGMEYSRRWFSANAEFEENDATFGSFRGYTGLVSLYTDGTQSWNARVNADYAHRNYTDDAGEIVDRFALSGGVSRRFFKRGLLEAEGSWLRERWSGESSDANDIDSMHAKLKYSWWYGKVEVKLETGFAQILRPTEDRSVYRVDLRVRRVF